MLLLFGGCLLLGLERSKRWLCVTSPYVSSSSWHAGYLSPRAVFPPKLRHPHMPYWSAGCRLLLAAFARPHGAAQEGKEEERLRSNGVGHEFWACGEEGSGGCAAVCGGC